MIGDSVHCLDGTSSPTPVRRAHLWTFTCRRAAQRTRIPTTVIPAKAGTQSANSGMNSAAAASIVAHAARAFMLQLVWVPAGSLTLARRDDVF
jgi:hypothetical protein